MRDGKVSKTDVGSPPGSTRARLPTIRDIARYAGVGKTTVADAL